MDKKQFKAWIDEKTAEGSHPIFFCIDPANGGSKVMAVKNGSGWENTGGVEFNLDRFSQYIQGSGYYLAGRPLLYGPYQYIAFRSLDDMTSTAEGVKQLQQVSREHDQGEVDAETIHGLYNLLSNAPQESSRITLNIQIHFASRKYVLTGIRYQGSDFIDAAYINLEQATFNATLRAAGWTMEGSPSHQKQLSLVGDLYVANNYHYVLIRGQGINRLNLATDLQEYQASKGRVEAAGRILASKPGLSADTLRSSVPGEKIAELEAISDLLR